MLRTSQLAHDAVGKLTKASPTPPSPPVALRDPFSFSSDTFFAVSTGSKNGFFDLAGDSGGAVIVVGVVAVTGRGSGSCVVGDACRCCSSMLDFCEEDEVGCTLRRLRKGLLEERREALFRLKSFALAGGCCCGGDGCWRSGLFAGERRKGVSNFAGNY